MEKEMIQFIVGLLFVAFIPVIVLRQLLREAVFYKKAGKYISVITIVFVSIFSAMYQNNDILMGTIIGSAVFQLLGICGVNKLRDRVKEENTYSGQYLIFCTILLLFLSADYLLKGESTENILNQIDGALLILLYGIYFFLMYRKSLNAFWQRVQEKDLERRNEMSGNDNISDKPDRKLQGKEIPVYVLLIIGIAAGSYFLFESVSSMGVRLEISQYSIGLTWMTWCVNLSDILFFWFTGDKEENLSKETNIKSQQTNRRNQRQTYQRSIGNTVDKVIFFISILLGGIILIRPIVISTYIIYDLIILGIITVLLQFVQKIDNRLAGSGMATFYIGFIVYAMIR